MAKLTTVIKICFLLFIVSCNGYIAPFENAKKLITKKDYKKAIEILTDIIKKQPDFDSAYIERGYSYSRIYEFQKAFDDYNHAMLNPAYRIAALDGRAALYFQIREYQKAIDDCSQILLIDSNNYHAYYCRGMAKMKLPIYGYNPDSTSTRYSRDEKGSFYIDYYRALKDLDKAIELNPKFSPSYLQRGQVFEELNQTDKALEEYNLALKLDSNSFHTYFRRALLYKTLGNVKAALADLNKAIEIDPNDPFPYSNRGYIKKESLNDKDGACDDFKKAEKLGLRMDDEDKKYCD